MLQSGKLYLTSSVWLCTDRDEKLQKQSVRRDQEAAGNMDAELFLEWLRAVRPCLRAARFCDTPEQLHREPVEMQAQIMPDMRRSAEEIAADAAVLARVLGRTLVLHLDGARHHVRTNPGYIPRAGRGGIYGPAGWGRESRECGMTVRKCVDVPTPPLGVPTAADEQWREHLLSVDVLDLQRMVDEAVPKERLEAQAIRHELRVHMRLTPPYCGKWMSGVEMLWAELKHIYRASFAEERGS